MHRLIRPRLQVVVLAWIVLFAGPALAQIPEAWTAGNVVDPARLARVDSVLERYVREGRIAGAVGLVMQDGAVVYERAVGWADREADRPMTTDAIFRIASQSKALTSTAIMMLVEEGVMNLGDPVSRWMPTFAETTVAVASDTGVVVVPAHRPITIRDLLTHTAGLSYGGGPTLGPLYAEQGLGYGEAYGWYTAHKDEPICTTMDRLGTLPFAAQPGADWVYGYATDVLGCVVERASGQPFDAFLRERLTGPLGMEDTHFFLPPEDRGRLATVYTPGQDGRVERAPDGPRGQGDYVDGPRRSFSGGAGLLSSARDYARFLEMLRNGGTLEGVRYLAPHTVAVMTSDQVGTRFSEDGVGFGLGFQTTDRLGANGFASVGTFGWSGAYGSVYEVDPKERTLTVRDNGIGMASATRSGRPSTRPSSRPVADDALSAPPCLPPRGPLPFLASGRIARRRCCGRAPLLLYSPHDAMHATTRSTLLLIAGLTLVGTAGCQRPEVAAPTDASSASGVAGVFDGSGGRWIDLSHAYSDETIYWPTDTTGFELDELAYGETEGGYFYSSYRFSTAEHGGTHLDAPIHFARGARTVDALPLEQLIAPAVVVDVTAQATPDYQATTQDLQAFEAAHGPIPDGAIVLIRTGWSDRWPDRAAYLGTDATGPEAIPNLHFPGLHPEAARWLVENRRVGAVGLDTPSVDYGQSADFQTHVVLYTANVPGFENVTNLGDLPPTGSFVVALPMKIEGGSGAPLRIVAFVPN